LHDKHHAQDAQRLHRPHPVRPRQLTTWHITFGTYGTRLNGGDCPTVDRSHKQFGEPFIQRDDRRAAYEKSQLASPMVILTTEQRQYLEHICMEVCDRVRWLLHAFAAPADGDHIHALLSASPEPHGKNIRQWLKRWLGESLWAQ
jgi:hypothetical protein